MALRLHTTSWRSVSGCKLLLEARVTYAFQLGIRCAVIGILATGEGWLEIRRIIAR